MSLVVEEQALASLSETLTGLGPGAMGGEEHPGLGLIRFMSDVRTVVNALLLGAGLEGGRFARLVEDYSVEEGVPRAKVLLVVGDIMFYLYAKPYMDVLDIDVLVDEAGEAAERIGAGEVVPVAAGYQYTFDAERYAKSIDVEVLRLGL